MVSPKGTSVLQKVYRRLRYIVDGEITTIWTQALPEQSIRPTVAETSGFDTRRRTRISQIFAAEDFGHTDTNISTLLHCYGSSRP